MSGFRASLNSFAAGEIGLQTRSRWDTGKYQTGLDLARNVLVLPAGGVYNRPGLRFCSAVRDSESRARLIPFTFSVGQAYALEFTDELMRVYYEGGLVLRPELEITAATNSNPLTVTIPESGYEIGWDVYFVPGSIEGMTELNGLTLRVTNVVGNVVTFGGVDSTGWGVFTGSTGGVPGDDEGGSGGYPPEPPPGTPDPPIPPFPDTSPPPNTDNPDIVQEVP